MTALTESHLKGFNSNVEIYISGYKLYRSNRSEETLKGKVITYIKEEFGVGSEVLSNGVVEWIFIFLPMTGSVMQISIVYHHAKVNFLKNPWKSCW